MLGLVAVDLLGLTGSCLGGRVRRSAYGAPPTEPGACRDGLDRGSPRHHQCGDAFGDRVEEGS